MVRQQLKLKYRDKQTIENPHQLHLTQKLQIRHQNYLIPNKEFLSFAFKINQ